MKCEVCGKPLGKRYIEAYFDLDAAKADAGNQDSDAAHYFCPPQGFKGSIDPMSFKKSKDPYDSECFVSASRRHSQSYGNFIDLRKNASLP